MSSASIPEGGPPPSSDPCALQLLGRFALRWGGQVRLRLETRKAMYLLAYLALHSDQYVERDQLIDLFWPESDLDRAGNSLSHALLAIRKALGEMTPAEESRRVLQSQRVGIRLALPPDCAVDALEFQRLSDLALRPGLGGEERIQLLEAAAERYGGPLLPGCSVEWFEATRRHLEQRYEECLLALVEAWKARRQPARVIKWAQQALLLDPCDETLHQEIIRQLAASGDRSGIIRQYEECRRRLAAEGLEPAAETVALYHRLLAPTPVLESGSTLRPVDLEAPLTGRDRELERLWQAWGVTAHGAGELVFLSGEAGIGKSRLGTELMLSVEHAGGLAIYGQGSHLEGGLLYHPLIDALRMAIAKAERSKLERGTPLVLAHVARLLPELRERFPDLPSVGQGEETDLFDALCRFFHDLARQRPVCLFMDDLHWADDATLRFLHYLGRRSGETRLLLVGAFREAEAQENRLLVRWQREVEARRPEMRLTLPRLSEAAVEELLQRLAGEGAPSLPDGFTRLLCRETEGNPLHLQLTLRSLFEEEWLSRDEAGNWRLGPRMPLSSAVTDSAGLDTLFDQLPLSHSIRDWIQSRMERLGERERLLLHAAAVLGRSFDPDLLGRVAGAAPAGDLAALERLLALDLLREASSGKLEFAHDRIREVVYGTLTLPRRQALHLNAGRALEARVGPRAEEWAAELADHFMNASQPAGTEPAVRYLLLAGKTARGLFAHAEAARHLENARELLALLPDSETRRTLRSQVIHELARVYRALGDPDRGEALLVGYIRQSRLEKSPAEEAQGCYFLAAYLWVGQTGPRDLERIERLYQQCLGLCARAGLERWSTQPRLDLLLFYMTLRPDSRAAEQLAAKLMCDLDQLEGSDAREALTLLIGYHGAQGRWEEAEAAFDRSLQHGGPVPVTFHLVLGWLAAQAEREGRQKWYAVQCHDWRSRAVAAGCDELPGQWYLEPAEPIAECGRPLLDLDFTQEPMLPELLWIDPLDLGSPVRIPGQGLVLAPRPGVDLWPHSNLNAPRLLFDVHGDFVVETRVDIGASPSIHASLLAWSSERDFVRLDRVRDGSHGDGVYMGAYSNSLYSYLGQGRFTDRTVWLRLERKGIRVRGLCSMDRKQWWACGSGTFLVENQVRVGICCVGFEPGVMATFERLMVWSGPGGTPS